MITQASIVAAFAVLASAALDKPPLSDNLDYLHDGNANALAPTQSTQDQWEPGLVPWDCKYHAEQSFQLNAKDIEVYNVTYTDCQDPWVICRHKDSPVDIITIVDTFGRMPVGMRDWVRQAMSFPNPDGASAFNDAGNIVFSDVTASNIDVYLHETGHSLDGQGAVNGQPQVTFSGTQPWTDRYNADANVPDNYAQSSMAEDFAQNTVIAVFDTVVEGGFPGVQPNWAAVSQQYSLIKDRVAGIVPGGTCNRHLAPSNAVDPNSDLFPSPPGHDPTNLPPVTNDKRSQQASNWFKGNYDLVEGNYDFTTRDTCQFGRKM